MMTEVDTDLDYIQVVRYHMTRDESSKNAGFGHVFHHVDVIYDKKIETSELSIGPSHFPMIKLNEEFFEQGAGNTPAPIGWAVEILKHNLWHLLCGHAERRVEDLVSHYGEERVQAAADLVVNQYANIEAYKQAGVSLVTPEDLKLEDSQTLEYYVSKLAGIPKKSWPVPVGTCLHCATETDIQRFVEISNARGKLAGELPGEAEEYIDQLFSPAQVDWDYFLKEKEGVHRGKLTRITKNRPSRRCDYHYGRRHIGVLNVAFVIDTSGSMDAESLAQSGPEIDAVAERGAEVMIVHADRAVAKVFQYIIGMDLGEFFGRGGTSFCPAFEELKKMEWQPDFVVYFTDGYGDAPEKEPYDTLWVLVDDGMDPEEFKEQVCSWGTICKIRGNPLS